MAVWVVARRDPHGVYSARMTTIIGRTYGLALDLLFPPQCAICRRAGAMLCSECAARLPLADGRRCAQCWIAIKVGGRCGECVRRPLAFMSNRSTFVFDGGARELEHHLKFRGMHALAAPMAALMFESLDAARIDLIAPVPLHRRRERSRGYNQAALLGKQLASLSALPFDPQAATRVRATARLTKTTRREDRFAIVKGAFTARRERVEGRAILLVDDVITTGATLDACASALLAAGAKSVHCATWARND